MGRSFGALLHWEGLEPPIYRLAVMTPHHTARQVARASNQCRESYALNAAVLPLNDRLNALQPWYGK